MTRTRQVDRQTVTNDSSTNPGPDIQCVPYKVDGSGPLLIYVAGLDGTGELFFKQIPALSTNYRVVTYRLCDTRNFTYQDLTRDLAGIIRHQQEPAAIIVGESFGGTVALEFAMRHPEMVERLVIINSFPHFRRRMLIRGGLFIASRFPFNFTWLVRRAMSGLGLIADRVSAEDRQRFLEAARTVTKAAYVRRLELIANVNMGDRIAAITAPTLFVAGDSDLLVPSVKEATAMANLVTNAKLHILEGVGHAALLLDRVSVAKILEEWIGSNPVSCEGTSS